MNSYKFYDSINRSLTKCEILRHHGKFRRGIPIQCELTVIEKTMQKGKQLIEGYDTPTAQEVADYNHFCADRFPSFSQLELVDEPDAPPSMALYVLAGRRMDV